MGNSDPFLGLVFLATFAGVVIYAVYTALKALVAPRVARWAYLALQVGITGGLTLASLALIARLASF